MITICICTYNGSKTLERCFKSLPQSEKVAKLLIDNNSSETERIKIKELSKKYDVEYFIEKKQGLSHARNMGINICTTPYISYLDDDAYLGNYWLEALLNNINSGKKFSCIGGPIYPYYDQECPYWFPEEYEIRNWGDKARYLKLNEERSGFSGSNMTFKLSLLKKYGGFRTDFGMSGKKIKLGEESQLFNQMLKNNEKLLFEPQMIVYHYVPAEKMKLSYRIKRGIEIGKTSSRLNKKVSFKKNLNCLIANLFKMIWKYFLFSIKKNQITYRTAVQASIKYGYCRY